MKESTVKKFKFGFLFLVAVIYLFKILASVFHFLSPVLIENIFEIVGEIASIIIILYGVFQNQIVMKRIWIYFAIGIFMNFIGDLIWNVNEIAFHRELSDVSVFAVFYVAGSIFFLIAIFSYLGKNELYSRIRTGFDVGIVMTVSMALLYKYILMPIWINESLSLPEKIILLFYPVMDLGYIASMLSYIFNKKIISPKFRITTYLMIGFLLFFVADILYTVDFADPIKVMYYPLWVMGYASIALASLYSNNNIAENYQKSLKVDKNKSKGEYFMFLSPYIIACAFILLFNAKYILQDSLAVGATVTLVLIVLRQIFVLYENLNLLDAVEKTNQMLEEYALDLDQKNKNLYELKKQKEHEASIDFLTQLYNRRYLSDWGNKRIAKLEEDDMIETSNILIDIDHYKEINDQYGHNVGDLVLKEIAQIIQQNIRLHDIAGRHGGDEFVVFLTDTELETAERIGNRLREQVRGKKFEEYPGLHITLSIGIIHWKGTKKDYSMDYLISKTDEALYEAKRTGRDRIVSKEI